jgi:hypothetical protein
MMKTIMNIMAITAGILMVVPAVWPWMRRLSVRGRHAYNPCAHTDVIYSMGSRSISGDLVLRLVAVVGLALILVGMIGAWRAMK